MYLFSENLIEHMLPDFDCVAILLHFIAKTMSLKFSI